jgi:hypothetical protein
MNQGHSVGSTLVGVELSLRHDYLHPHLRRRNSYLGRRRLRRVLGLLPGGGIAGGLASQRKSPDLAAEAFFYASRSIKASNLMPYIHKLEGSVPLCKVCLI